MLVLTRKLYERILIGDDIAIQVVAIDRNKIRLGITCPRGMPIYREEIAPAVATDRGSPSGALPEGDGEAAG